MLSSFRSKLLLTLLGVVFLSTLLITLFVRGKTEDQISYLQHKSAQDFLYAVTLSVESQYNHLLADQEMLLEHKRQDIQKVLQIAASGIENQYQRYELGVISEAEAKKQAIEFLRKMEESGGGGFWIQDTTPSFSKIVMHSTMPQFEGYNSNDPLFNCGQDTENNLFVLAVETARNEGAGYLNYQCDRMVGDFPANKNEQLAYVMLFKKWNWVVGLGVPLDDLQLEIDKQVDILLSDLTKVFQEIRVGKSGYMYLFTGDMDMLIHPSLVGADFSNARNPASGNLILDDLMTAAKSPEKMLEYIWDKPPEHKGEFRFWKTAHITYFEPLDWYFGSTVYSDEIEAPAKDISNYILLISLVILVLTFYLSLLLSNNLSKPLQLLSQAAQKIEFDKLDKAVVPVTGSEETRHLGSMLNRMLESFRDAIQAKLALESRLHQAEKMESVGRLAAGIAHEINTPTQFVSTNVHFLEDAHHDIEGLIKKINNRLQLAHENKEIPQDILDDVSGYMESADWDFLEEEIPQALEQSEDGLKRVAKIVQAMKNFSHPGSGELELTDINEGVQNTVTVARNEWKYAAEMVFRLNKDLPQVPCYRDELNQVILNMIINSAHAIKEHNRGEEEKGTITISTGIEGDTAQIIIHDTGVGMDNEMVAKIFDPFFTTKEVGKGSGQGLAIAHDIIINKHGGTIDVESKPGIGTTFVIGLPVKNPT